MLSQVFLEEKEEKEREVEEAVKRLTIRDLLGEDLLHVQDLLDTVQSHIQGTLVWLFVLLVEIMCQFVRKMAHGQKSQGV